MRKAHRKKIRAWNAIYDIAFVAPQLILYLTLTVVPFIAAFPMVFTNKATFLDQAEKFIGLGNVRAVFQEPIFSVFSAAVSRTAVFTLLNYGMVFFLGMTLALIMYEFQSKLKKAFFNIVYLPYMISGVGTGMMLILLFSRDTGTVNLLMHQWSPTAEPIDINTPLVTAISMPLVVGWRSAGFNMALFLSGLLSVPTDTIDACVVDGANYSQRLRHVYFPQMVPSIIIATVFCLIGSFGIFDEPAGMGAFNGNEGAMYFAILLYLVGFPAGQEPLGTLSESVTMALVVYFPLFLLAYLLNKLQKRLQY